MSQATPISWLPRRILAVILILSLFAHDAVAKRLIESTSLDTCMENSSFSATLFNISYSPDDNQLHIKITGVADIEGNVTAGLSLIAYGYNAMQKTLDPCKMTGFEGMCPMSEGQIELDSSITVEASVAQQIPPIAYQVPDLDGRARIIVNNTDTGEMVACVEAPLSNGKTVDQHAVGWCTAIIAGMGLVASAVTSGLGHSNTAAHVAANAMSLFGYFQGQAMIGMTGVELPPIVSAWTQNFDWSMGIIRIAFMQNILSWYIQATGGTPSTLLQNLDEISVIVNKKKRSVDVNAIPYHMTRAAMYGFAQFEPEVYGQESMALGSSSVLKKRSNNHNAASTETEIVKVSGIERVAYKADIEASNFFITGLAFFVAFLALVAMGVCAFKGVCELAVKAGHMKGSKFLDFRNGWLTVLKGIMYRLVLIGFPQMAILCLWELTVRDSAAAVVLAIFFFLSVVGILGWAAFKVIHIAQRSVALHKNPAYILYSDPASLNRWGFLYVQFRASSYFFIVPFLVYLLVKAIFIAFGQSSAKLQGVALLLIEIVFLGAVGYMRPWMDKKTNIFNISIHACNFLNAVFLLVFTGIFNSPDIVTGVMGVIFFVMNAVFSLVLLILVLISSVYAVISKNPDVRYQPMRDDRGSFIKTDSRVIDSTELNALSATARGKEAGYSSTRDLDADPSDDSLSPPGSRGQFDPSQISLPPSTANSTHAPSVMGQPPSPLDPAVPLFPTHSQETTRNPYSPSERSGGNDFLSTGNSPPNRTGNRSPAPSNHSYDAYRTPTWEDPARNQQSQQPMQWHVGAGYEH